MDTLATVVLAYKMIAGPDVPWDISGPYTAEECQQIGDARIKKDMEFIKKRRMILKFLPQYICFDADQTILEVKVTPEDGK